jgi:hypothetical protein
MQSHIHLIPFSKASPPPPPLSQSLHREYLLYKLRLNVDPWYEKGSTGVKCDTQVGQVNETRSIEFSDYLRSNSVGLEPMQLCEEPIWTEYLKCEYSVEDYLLLPTKRYVKLTTPYMPFSVVEHFYCALQLVAFEDFCVRGAYNAKRGAILVGSQGDRVYLLAAWNSLGYAAPTIEAANSYIQNADIETASRDDWDDIYLTAESLLRRRFWKRTKCIPDWEQRWDEVSPPVEPLRLGQVHKAAEA